MLQHYYGLNKHAVGNTGAGGVQERYLEAESGAKGSSRSEDHFNSSDDGLEVFGTGASVPVRGCATAASTAAGSLIRCRLNGLSQPAHQTKLACSIVQTARAGFTY